MKKLVVIAGIAALGLTGCEANESRRSNAVGPQIARDADFVCAGHGKTASVTLIESDDILVTCKDGTNHYYDG